MAKNRSAKQDAELIKRREREKQALHLRRQSFTYEQIAERLGYSDRGTAYAAVKRAIHRITADDAEHLAMIESDKLDVMERQINEAISVAFGGRMRITGRDVVSGESRTVESILPTNLRKIAQLIVTKTKIMQRRARLHGLDAPPKIPIDATLPPVPPKIIFAYGEEPVERIPEGSGKRDS